MGESRAAQTQDAGREIERLTPAQQKLAAGNIGLVGMHLNNRVPTPKYPTRGRDYDDLFQEGCLALVRAASRYRADPNRAFGVYALPRIRGAVHTALFEQFGTIRMSKEARRAAVDRHEPACKAVHDLPRSLVSHDPGRQHEEGRRDSIRHLLRRRFERAVRAALERTQAGPKRTLQRNAALARVATERVLISREAHRTPIRRLERETGISSGRLCEYEHRLLDLTRRYMREDAPVALLVRFARIDPAGFDAPLDDARLQQVEDAELRQFQRAFTAMDHPKRAETLYRLVEASTSRVDDVARNLFRLASRSGNIVETWIGN